MALSDAPDRTIGYTAESTNSPWVGTLDHLIEDVPELTDRRRSVDVYRRMRNDPRLTAVMNAVELLVQRATWVVDPAGASGAMTEQVADDLGLAVMGRDRPKVGRVRGVLWPEHLRLALLELAYGHMAFEPEAAVVDGRARLVALHERPPSTIQDINTDDQGRLLSIRQDPMSGLKQRPPIPADRLVFYSHKREGAAWRGRSLLRPAYGPWLVKHEIERVTAMGMRRFYGGIPQVTAPPGATPQQITEAQQLASRMRAGEMSGIGLPAGYTATVAGIVGSVPDTMPFIHYLDRQMSEMVLAQFIDLGQTGSGSTRSLGGTFVDFFTMTVEAICNEIANAATRQICVPLTNWNEGEAAPAPAISVSDVGTAHEVTAEAITALAQAGVLTMDDATEDYVRQTWRLPRRTAPRPRAVQPQAQQAGQRLAAAAGDDQDDPASAAQDTAGRLDREWQTALAALLLLYRRKRQGDVEDVLLRLRDIADSGTYASLAGLTVTATGEGADAIAQAMRSLASSAAEGALSEAAVRGVTPTPSLDVDALGDRLAGRATVVDDLLTSGLANSAVREATRKWGLPTGELVDEVRAALEGLSGAWVEGHLGGALTSAQNDGRGLVFAQAPAGTAFTAVEVLDATVCRPCAAVAGRVYPDWAAALVDYPNGQYRNCLGRERCRGFLIPNY